MRLLVFADLHGSIKDEEIPGSEPDIVVSLGDVDRRDLIKIADAYPDAYHIGVMGNHDRFDEIDRSGFVNLHGNKIEIDGYVFGGFGGCPRYNMKKNQYDEEDVESSLENMEDVDVFIAHSNPSVIGDQPSPHQGFEAFTEYISEVEPALFLHGHLHENEQYEFGETHIISVYGFQEILI